MMEDPKAETPLTKNQILIAPRCSLIKVKKGDSIHSFATDFNLLLKGELVDMRASFVE